MKKGFTLIELLIVVAIIAILAAIAVPNFLEAQIRAKTSRARADMRSIATAIESYAVDNNRPPREYDDSLTVDGLFQGQNASGILSPVISTPIAYITQAFLLDPFALAGDLNAADEKYFSYASAYERKGITDAGGSAWFFGGPLTQPQRSEAILGAYGSWYLISVGPDRSFWNNPPLTTRGGITGREYIPYDPTNGTVSQGNVIRSQARSENYLPPVTPETIVGAH